MFYKSLNPFELLFELQLRDYYNYIDIMEQSIQSRKKTLLEMYEKESKELDYQIKQELFEMKYLDDYLGLDETFTYILRKSLFITLHSFMESELNKITRSLELKNIKLSDVKHSGIKKYVFYIENVLNINISLSEETRKTLIKYTDLRNYFVHNEGVDINYKMYKNFKALPHVIIDKDPYFDTYEVKSLEKDFNITYLDLIAHIFKQLYKSLDGRLN